MFVNELKYKFFITSTLLGSQKIEALIINVNFFQIISLKMIKNLIEVQDKHEIEL
jgi:hypothetical protein